MVIQAQESHPFDAVFLGIITFEPITVDGSDGQGACLCCFPAFSVLSCLRPAHQSFWLGFHGLPVESFQRSFPTVWSVEASVVWSRSSVCVNLGLLCPPFGKDAYFQHSMNCVRSRQASHVTCEAEFCCLDRADHADTVLCPEPLSVPVESSSP